MAKQDSSDYFTKSGAQILADRIVAYWRTRGYRGIEARLYKFVDRNDKGQESLCYGVRSNIKWNGYPPVAARR